MITNAYLRAVSAFEAVIAIVAAHLRGRQTAPTGHRAVTFIEYALLAAIAVFVGWIFREQLSTMFTKLLGDISGALNTAKTS